jgi:hypothetical protein
LTPMSSSARIGQQIKTKLATSNSLSRSLRVSWPLRSARIQTLCRRGVDRSQRRACVRRRRERNSASVVSNTPVPKE